MAKKYNLTSKTDMRRFQKDLEGSIVDMAKQNLMARKYSVKCPHCEISVNVPVGKSACPICKQQIDLNLNMNF